MLLIRNSFIILIVSAIVAISIGGIGLAGPSQERTGAPVHRVAELANDADKRKAIEKELRFEGPRAIIFGMKILSIRTADQVKNGCYTNSKNVKTAIELVFRKHGFQICSIDESDALSNLIMPQFVFRAIGYRNKIGTRSIGCSAYVSTHFQYLANFWVPHSSVHSPKNAKTYSPADILRNGTLITGGGDNLNSQIKNVAIENTEEAVNSILSARQYMFSKYAFTKKLFEEEQMTDVLQNLCR